MGLRSSLTLDFYKKAHNHIVSQYPFGTVHLEGTIYGYEIWDFFLSLHKDRVEGTEYYTATLGAYTYHATLALAVFPGMKVLAMPQRRYGTA